MKCNLTVTVLNVTLLRRHGDQGRPRGGRYTEDSAYDSGRSLRETRTDKTIVKDITVKGMRLGSKEKNKSRI